MGGLGGAELWEGVPGAKVCGRRVAQTPSPELAFQKGWIQAWWQSGGSAKWVMRSVAPGSFLGLEPVLSCRGANKGLVTSDRCQEAEGGRVQ